MNKQEMIDHPEFGLYCQDHESGSKGEDKDYYKNLADETNLDEIPDMEIRLFEEWLDE